MSQFSAGMQTALLADTPLLAGLLESNLPGGVNVRLLDGAGELVWGTKTFVGRDVTFGVLAAIDDLSDGVGDEAPAINITLHPADDAVAASLSSPTMQGSPVSLWLAAIDRTTGAVVADPLLMFLGELDQPILRAGKGTRTLEYECVSAFERLFDNQEGQRLADSWHKGIWPGETGLANVTGLPKMIYWGTDRPQGGAVSGGLGGGSGSGGGGLFGPSQRVVEQ